MDEILAKILNYAIIKQISDIHFFQKREQVFMSWRTSEGLFKSDQSVPESLLSYILYIAKLDISLRSKPQTGAFEHFYQNHCYSVRVAMMQSLNNISIVLRILNQYSFLNFSDLTDEQEVVHDLSKLLTINYGLIVFSGPTGSGKTTSAYTMLNQYLNKAIYSIEDPIEIYFENIIQLQVNETMNFSFEQGIRQILRHDPDIIFIGEIRDSYSAKMAVRCALSGHLVVATIHSGSAKATLKRFKDFGISEDDLQEVVKSIVNQRLLYQNQMGRFFARYEILTCERMENWNK